MSYRFSAVFVDLDDTVLDFKRSEKEAVSKTLPVFGLEPTDSATELYSRINEVQWKLLEKGVLSREEVLTRRFALLFETYALPLPDPAEVWRVYEKNLSLSAHVIPGAAEAIVELKKDHRVFVATNGTEPIQRSRLRLSGVGGLFDGVFISQEIGFNKPSREFFDAMLERAGVSARDSVMIGDSLSSDIAGGAAAGMKTIHYMSRPASYPDGIRPDMTVTDVAALPGAVQLLELKTERSSL